MNEIEKIRKYIEKSNVPHNRRYDTSMKEVFALTREMGGADAIALAFEYGRAKGVRMARAEGRVRA